MGQTGGAGYAQPLQFGLTSLLFLLAFGAIFIGALLMALGSMSNLGTASSGAVILFGPIPIVIGGGPYSFQLIELAAVLTILAVIVFLVFLFVRKHS